LHQLRRVTSEPPDDEVVVTGYRTQADRDWYAANFNSIGYTGPHKDYFPSKKPDYVAPQITKISLGKVLTQALGIGSLPAAGAFGVAGVGIAATSLATKLPILNEAGLLALEVGVGDAIGGASILRAGGAVIGLGAAGLKSLDNLAASHILQRTSNGSYLAESDFGVLTKAYEPSTLNIAGLESGHSFARSVTEGGTGRSVAGHGSYWSQDGFSIVPEGTSITLPREGISIADKTGRYIENGDWSGLMRAANVNERIANDIQGMTTWLPGATVPNYTLTKPNGLNIYSRSSSTNAPVTLNNLLSPNMGCVNWAACTVFID